MLLAGWEVHIVKTCDRGLKNTAFSSLKSQFFTIQTDPKRDYYLFLPMVNYLTREFVY